jgi:hypothetical protein
MRKRAANDNRPTTTTTQTVRINGARVRVTTRNGRVTQKPAPILESDGQAAQVRALRAMPEYGKLFTIAARMEAGKRGPHAQAIALATGMVAGEPDMAAYGSGGRLLLWENKVGNGRLSPAQVARHAVLARLGHHVHVLRFSTCEDAAAQAVRLVRGWLAGIGRSTSRVHLATAQNNAPMC